MHYNNNKEIPFVPKKFPSYTAMIQEMSVKLCIMNDFLKMICKTSSEPRKGILKCVMS